MKRIFANGISKILLAFVLVLLLSIPALAASTTYKAITVNYSNISLNVDGSTMVPKGADGNRVEPFTYNGTTFLPLRVVADLLNKDVSWNSNNKTVYLSDKAGTGTVNNNVATATTGKISTETIKVAYMGIQINVNGIALVQSAEPFSYNGTIYLPVRAIGTALGKNVSYDSGKKVVYLTGQTGDKLSVHFLDVGQGDSIFIKLPNNETMLIDAGNAENGTEIVNYIKNQGCDTINYLVATHPHADHIGGMEYVVNNLNIKSVYMPKAEGGTQTYEDLLTAIQNKGLTIKTAKAGVNIIDTDSLDINIIAPNSDSYDNLNNYSAVVKLTYKNNSFLFMGDAETISENEITTDVKADVLKVGHHGSISSTGQSFLNKVSSEYAVISVGAGNDYGHPAQTTIDKLLAIGAAVYRTDKDGTVVFASDGTNITVDKASSTNSSGSSNGTTSQTTSKNVIISSVDKVGEVVTIKNTGSTDLDMTGWVLVSVTGNQSYTFPSYVLKANSAVKIASAGASGDLIWSAGNIWNNSSSDPAKLYDSQGNLIYSYSD